MKAIILISSIFYILGLKISNKIDLVKKTSPAEKVIMHTIKSKQPQETADFNEVEIKSKEIEKTKDTGNCKNVD